MLVRIGTELTSGIGENLEFSPFPTLSRRVIDFRFCKTQARHNRTFRIWENYSRRILRLHPDYPPSQSQKRSVARLRSISVPQNEVVNTAEPGGSEVSPRKRISDWDSINGQRTVQHARR